MCRRYGSVGVGLWQGGKWGGLEWWVVFRCLVMRSCVLDGVQGGSGCNGGLGWMYNGTEHRVGGRSRGGEGWEVRPGVAGGAGSEHILYRKSWGRAAGCMTGGFCVRA